MLVSGGNQIATPKLLGIPTAPDATGKSQKDEVVKLLRDWKLEPNLIGVVFDTTASNTGVRSGCAVLLEKEFNKPLLWLACRHHIHELHIRHAWDAVAGQSNSPIEPLLKRFQQQWITIDISPDDLVFFDPTQVSLFICG